MTTIEPEPHAGEAGEMQLEERRAVARPFCNVVFMLCILEILNTGAYKKTEWLWVSLSEEHVE
jgi:hypothetical protein